MSDRVPKTTLEGYSDKFSTYVLTWQDVPATGDAKKPVLWAVLALITLAVSCVFFKETRGKVRRCRA